MACATSLQILVDLTPASSPWNQQALPDLVRGLVEERREERSGIGPMTKNSVVQQALLKPEFAHLYPGVASNEWQPAGLMLEQVNATFRRRTASPKARAALDTAHFMFRGTQSESAKHVAHELRNMGKR